MLPGPTLLLACTRCEALMKVPSWLSRNTFGATYWTDGFRDTPSLPEPGPITRCPECGRLGWIDEYRQVGVLDDEYNPGLPAIRPRRTVRPLTTPGVDDYLEAIDAGLGTTRQREKTLRFRVLWRGNDCRRRFADSWDVDAEAYDLGAHLEAIGTHGCEKAVGLCDHRLRRNMELLSKLLDPRRHRQRLLRAELARELGHFDEAIALLPPAEAIKDRVLRHTRDYIEALCRAGWDVTERIPGLGRYLKIGHPSKPGREQEARWNQDQPPCPYCGVSLRTAEARQCFSCGMDWHDPGNVVRRGNPPLGT